MKQLTLFAFFILICYIQCSDKNETTIITEAINTYTFKNEGRGCGDFIVYTFANDSTSMTIRGERDILGQGFNPKTFNLPHEDLNISINQFAGPAGVYYCDDVFGNEGSIISSSPVVSGQAIIEVLEDNSLSPSDQFFIIKVELVFVVFKLEDETTEFYSSLIFDDVSVGWIPG